MHKQPPFFIFPFINRLVSLVVLSSFSFGLFGQGSNIKFKHLSLREGLSQSTVNCIYQDDKGFMWFGTQDGLNRYDGYEFKTFKNVPGDTSTLTSGFINSILQLDKHLWIGTNYGINCLNFGNLSLKNYTSGNSKLPSNEIKKLLLDEDENIWIGTSVGLTYYNKDSAQFTNFYFIQNGENTPIVVNDIADDLRQTLWIATENEGLLMMDKKEGRIKRIGKSHPALGGAINSLLIDKNGDLLVGTEQNGLVIIGKKDGEIAVYRQSDNYLSLSENHITRIFIDHEGKIWVGTNGGGLNRFKKSAATFHSFKRRINDESSISSNNVSAIFEDRTGVLWVGTELGINYFDLLKQNFNHYQTGVSSINSISGNIVWSLFMDEKNLIWIGTNEGLNTLNRETNEFQTYLPSISVNGVKRNTSIYAIWKDKAGIIWLGTDGGIYKFNETSKEFIRFTGTSNTSRTYVIYEDSKSRLWTGTKEGIVLLSANRTEIARFRKGTSANNGLPDDVTRAIIEDEEGDFWIGTDGGLCKISFDPNGKATFKSFEKKVTSSSAVNNSTILSLQQDDKGFIWLGTFGGGLSRFDRKSETFIQYTQKDGLPNNVVYGILKDDNNNLWLSTNRGIASFSIDKKSFRKFDESDGLQSNEFNVGAFFKSSSSELFFGGIKGFNSFFPANIRKNTIKPQLVLTDFELFNKSVKIGPNSKLPKHISELDQIELSYADNVFTFSYAALHYSMPERNRYAYKMEGFDENWIYDNSRKAKYTNLDPDNYIFKVKATNSDGYWGDEIAISVVIKPPFWKIKWVWALALFILGAGAFTFYQSRLKRIKAQKEFLEVQVKERTKELIGKNEEVEKQKALLEEEKDKLETLLLNILPQSTVEELKKKGKATARNYRKASVMFTDFKNFTRISEKLSPTELVERLDGFFVKFDSIIEKYNVEKIKTIGDAYMCAGGIPIRNKSNPVDVVLASLEIQRTMKNFAKNVPGGEETWGLRLGIHTGNLVAGVIGIKRFAYDIWGDTVNVASRVESGGEVGRVNVSGQTYEEIKEFFECEYRGKIHAKNKGDIDMFFVNKIKPELSVNEEGIEPNQAFWDYVNLHYISEIRYRDLEKFMVNKLSEELADDLYYHGVHHTIDVCEAVERIAHYEGVKGEDIFILKTAALFHDAGYTRKYRENEAIGVEIAKEILPEYGYNAEQIEKVSQLILSTFVERTPANKLEMIMRDGDLDYLGRDDFDQISTALKNELVDRKIVADELEWDKIQVDFLSKHVYFTASSKRRREAYKLENLKKVRERLEENV